jgi:hypothetical protein
VRRLQAVEKRRQALMMRRAGEAFATIAQRLGYATASGAFKAVETALRETLQEPADVLRKLERDRLDALVAKLWPLVVTEPPAPPDFDALDRLLKVMARRAKLDGLDVRDAGPPPPAELVVRLLGAGASMSELHGGKVHGAGSEDTKS